MTPEYRKLPGKRRGFFNVSSVWAGPDHLLLIRGSRFREEYKRFYYRDLQAIAVARAPRFHISTRGVAIGLASWAALLLGMRAYGPELAFPWQGAYTFSQMSAVLSTQRAAGQGLMLWSSLILALAWLVVWACASAMGSCRCRIYTAVSSDELPSVYRTWTARKFLAEVEPLIAQTQGAIQGEWAAAAEERAVGPALPASASLAPTSSAPAPPRRTLASGLFLVALFADAAVKLAPLRAPLATRLPLAMELVSVAAAVAVLVQHNRGRLRAGMHRVALASLIAFGIIYYAQSISVGISAGITAAKTGKQTTALAFPQWRLAQEVGAGIDAILLIVGLTISLREDEDRPWN